MNERIWELKQQAMLFAQEKCDGQTTDMHGNLRSNIWTEKFAELIVKDVLDKVLQAMDDGMDVYDTVADKFGVEE